MLRKDDAASGSRRNGCDDRTAPSPSGDNSQRPRNRTHVSQPRTRAIPEQCCIYTQKPPERHMTMPHKDILKQNSAHGDDIVAAASSCPAVDCGSLVIDYRAADNSRLGHAGDWGFTCSRCGLDFTVPLDDLIFRSIPKLWFSAATPAG